MMENVCIIPLDSRPCCRDLVLGPLKSFGMSPSILALEACGTLYAPAEHGAVKDFLINNASADTLLLSLDMYLYGGLIASRSPQVSVEEAMQRLDELRQLKRDHPALRILVSFVIMRISISAIGADSVKYWQLMHEYCSVLKADPARAEALRREIPRDIMDSFLAARQRNHRMNMEALALCAEGVFERVLLLQEDCAPGGIQSLEQDKLNARIDKLGISERAFLMNGADEGIQTLAAYRMNSGRPHGINVVDESGHSRVYSAPFEDRPFAENIDTALKAAGFVRDEASDTVLFVHTDKDNSNTPQAIKALLCAGKRVALLDVATCNGSDKAFINACAAAFDIMSLHAYSAWNTASNSLGTILCAIAGASNGKGDRHALMQRLLDDHLYQSIIRPCLNGFLQDIGVNPYSFGQGRETAEELLRVLLSRSREYMTRLCGCAYSASISFPWDRSFECRVEDVEIL